MSVGYRTSFKLLNGLRPDPAAEQLSALHFAYSGGHGSGGSKVPLAATVPREHTPSLIEAGMLNWCSLLGEHGNQRIQQREEVVQVDGRALRMVATDQLCIVNEHIINVHCFINRIYVR